MDRRRATAALLVIAAAVLAIAGAAGCSSQAPAPPGPQAKMERIGNSHGLSVVLTPTGAQRIGVQTAPVTAVRAGRPLTVIPYAALLYEQDGTPAVYVNTGPLTYTRYLVSVEGIAGDLVYISSGLTPGMTVVTTGAEELLGVQNGVGVET
jgi:hypothetical protein